MTGGRTELTILLHVETERDVTLEIDLPSLFDTDDIKVDFGEDGFRLEVEDYLSFSRQYWQPRYILILPVSVSLFC